MQTPQTDEARAAAYRRYLGYYGPFVVDEAKGIVTHIVDGSSNPSWVGIAAGAVLRALARQRAAHAVVTGRERAGHVSLVWKRSTR